MIKHCIISILILVTSVANGQHYLRGDVKTEKNVPLQNAKIFLHTPRTQYFSGADGSFGIIMRQAQDSITVSVDGYEPQTLFVKASDWQRIVLKTIITKTTQNKNKLISVTMDKQLSKTSKFSISDETYFQMVENEFIQTKAFPNTGFSLNVNKASYSNVRRFINSGSEVPPDAVRIEEMVNYFNLCYEEPEQGEDFKIKSVLTHCPWKPTDQLMFLNLNARKLNLDSIAPANFVFLIDVSGSMDDELRLPLVQSAFQIFIKNIRAVDTVSIVTYGGGVTIWLPPTAGNETAKISKAIEELVANGATPGEAALQTAYKLAESTYMKGGNNRIILATDGDFNVGETGEKELEELVARYKNRGIYLTCLGVGTGNLKDSKLQILAKKGNGNYAYLDDLKEAEKTLVQELTQTMYAVADDALVHIEFNPNYVKQYRLIGFDNRRTAVTDGENVLEGGDVGSGSSVLAIFQITPEVYDSIPSDDALANVKVSYQVGKGAEQKKMNYSTTDNFINFSDLPHSFQFSTAVAGLGLKLKNSDYAKISWDQLIELANYADRNNFLENEFVALVEKAMYIYEPKRKKKNPRK